jgi:hypothetical protein
MIIRVLGGNGAGKSHLVHRIIAMYGHRHDRDEVVESILLERGANSMQNVAVMGHYRIANGGLDTQPGKLAEAYDQMKEYADAGWHVLYEVSSQADGHQRLAALHQGGKQCRAILLSTTPDEQVASVRQRGHGIREDIIRASGPRAERITYSLAAAGIPILVLDREAALGRVIEYLRGAS